MARLFTCGAEIDASAGSSPDGITLSGGVNMTRDTSVFRSGLASYKCDTGAGNGASSFRQTVTLADSTTYFLRAYVLKSSNPTSTAPFLGFGQTGGNAARLKTDGSIELFAGGAAQGSPSGIITDGLWHKIDLKGVAGAGSSWSDLELFVDDISIATWSGNIARANDINWGWFSSPTLPGADQVINIDDLALNDSNGVSQNSFPGEGKVVLLKPTADSAVGTGWTTSGAGSTNLFDNVDNTPPTGIADTTSNAGHQIRNATSNANVNYDATMQSYTAVGVGPNDTISIVDPIIATAAPVSTSAKLGNVGVVSNPTIANIALSAGGTSGAFWSGVAAGTYPTGWKWSHGTLTYDPSVVVSTAPVMRVTQVTSSTRIAMACFMGIYIEYVEHDAPRPLVRSDAQHRASYW